MSFGLARAKVIRMTGGTGGVIGFYWVDGTVSGIRAPRMFLQPEKGKISHETPEFFSFLGKTFLTFA